MGYQHSHKVSACWAQTQVVKMKRYSREGGEDIVRSMQMPSSSSSCAVAAQDGVEGVAARDQGTARRSTIALRSKAAACTERHQAALTAAREGLVAWVPSEKHPFRLYPGAFEAPVKRHQQPGPHKECQENLQLSECEIGPCVPLLLPEPCQEEAKAKPERGGEQHHVLKAACHEHQCMLLLTPCTVNKEQTMSEHESIRDDTEKASTSMLDESEIEQEEHMNKYPVQRPTRIAARITAATDRNYPAHHEWHQSGDDEETHQQEQPRTQVPQPHRCHSKDKQLHISRLQHSARDEQEQIRNEQPDDLHAHIEHMLDSNVEQDALCITPVTPQIQSHRTGMGEGPDTPCSLASRASTVQRLRLTEETDVELLNDLGKLMQQYTKDLGQAACLQSPASQQHASTAQTHQGSQKLRVLEQYSSPWAASVPPACQRQDTASDSDECLTPVVAKPPRAHGRTSSVHVAGIHHSAPCQSPFPSSAGGAPVANKIKGLEALTSSIGLLITLRARARFLENMGKSTMNPFTRKAQEAYYPPTLLLDEFLRLSASDPFLQSPLIIKNLRPSSCPNTTREAQAHEHTAIKRHSWSSIVVADGAEALVCICKVAPEQVRTSQPLEPHDQRHTPNQPLPHLPLPPASPLLVQHYISNPFLMNG